MVPSTLLLLRHGLAEDPRPGQSDAERPLTPEGARRVRALGEGLASLGLVPDAVVSSPYVRAQQTAQALAGRPPRELLGELVPHGALDHAEFALRACMAELEPGRCLLAVSHLPLAELLVFRLGSVRCSLPPGHGVALAWDGHRFELVGRLQPEAPFLVRP